MAVRPAPNAAADGADLAAAVRAGDRRALARAITLIESLRPDHRARAEALVEALLPTANDAFRIGVSGAPGVGKSTFIEAFGLHLIGRGHRVAVLAVDPSSERTGGSILGDKTRMEDLAREDAAFIRPSPAAGTLGGVARRTHEAALACQAAGFDMVLIETVGVGQSETAVAGMVDFFLLLLQPAAGDDLQGAKRGIVELADLLLVTKADGALAGAAARTVVDFASALRLLRPASTDWRPEVRACSALTGDGIAAVRETVERFQEARTASGGLAARRAARARAWMWREVSDGLAEALRADAGVAALIPDLERRVAGGDITPAAAARALLDAFRRR